MKDITTEEAIKILEELSTFYDVKLENGDVAIEKVLNELEKKDKIINAMALQLSGISIWDDEKEDLIILGTEEEVKQHFERRAEDE